VIIGKLIPAATGMSQYRRLTVAVEGYGVQEIDDLDIAAS
jgi:DNA-directed RNA polymerase subunit beta'